MNTVVSTHTFSDGWQLKSIAENQQFLAAVGLSKKYALSKDNVSPPPQDESSIKKILHPVEPQNTFHTQSDVSTSVNKSAIDNKNPFKADLLINLFKKFSMSEKDSQERREKKILWMELQY